MDGCARASDGRSLAFAELAAEGLRVTTAFGNGNRLTYTYGSAAAHVAVDRGTGDVELLDFLVVEDVGRIVNPLTLHGQTRGGMVQGLGGAFLEHLVYDANGQLLSGNLADYLIPTTTDFDNRANLAPAFLHQIVKKYEGTRLGRQELNLKYSTTCRAPFGPAG